MFENNHDRTRYILSLMGYSLIKPTNENKKSLETKIYCFQKGHILTLHDKSLDFYSETEKNLFSKIINAISVSKNESFFALKMKKNWRNQFNMTMLLQYLILQIALFKFLIH